MSTAASTRKGGRCMRGRGSRRRRSRRRRKGTEGRVGAEDGADDGEEDRIGAEDSADDSEEDRVDADDGINDDKESAATNDNAASLTNGAKGAEGAEDDRVSAETGADDRKKNLVPPRAARIGPSGARSSMTMPRTVTTLWGTSPFVAGDCRLVFYGGCRQCYDLLHARINVVACYMSHMQEPTR